MALFSLLSGNSCHRLLKTRAAGTDRPTFKIGLVVIGLLQESLEVIEDFLLPQVVKNFLCVVFPGQSFPGKQSDKPLRTSLPSVPLTSHTARYRTDTPRPRLHPTDQSTGTQTFRPSVSWEVSALCCSPGLLPTLRAQAAPSVPGGLRESFQPHGFRCIHTDDLSRSYSPEEVF